MTRQELEENKIIIDEILDELKDNMEALESGNVDIDAVNVGISLAIYSAAKGMCERNLAANTSSRRVSEKLITACANGNTHEACRVWGTIDSKYYGLSRFFE